MGSQILDQTDIGAFRLRAALRQRGYHSSERTCSRIIEENRHLYQIPKGPKQPHQPRAMPFEAQKRHQFWSADVRYIEEHQLPDQEGPFYVISILENFSRAIVASDVSRTQTQEDYLKVLHASIFEHGTPEAVVTDGGGIFRGKAAMLIYEKLGVRKEQIEARQAWQNYIESAFNILRKMADFGFAQALTWERAQEVHERWLADYNHQEHWAHRHRADEKRTPMEVLQGEHGLRYHPSLLRRLFRNRHQRQANQWGYIRFRHWRLYSEAGLAGLPVEVWLTRQTLTIEYGNVPLAQYQVTFLPGEQHLTEIALLHVFETRHTPPRLMSVVGVEWMAVKRLAPYAARLPSDPLPSLVQLPLFADS